MKKVLNHSLTIVLILSLLMGLASVVISIFATSSGEGLVEGFAIKPIFSYLVPAGISVVYFILGFIYYKHNIAKSYEKLVM